MKMVGNALTPFAAEFDKEQFATVGHKKVGILKMNGHTQNFIQPTRTSSERAFVYIFDPDRLEKRNS